MKNTKIRFLLTLLTGFLLMTVGTVEAQDSATQDSANGWKKPSKDTVALVNGHPINKADYNRRVGTLKSQLLRQGQALDDTNTKEVRSQALEDLIDHELLYQESQKKGLKIKEEKINEQYEAVKGQFSSEEEFNSALADLNYTESSLKDELGRRMVVEKFIDGEITENITVSEEEALEFYESHPEYFIQPEQVRASHILITVDENVDASQKAEALKKIKAVMEKVKAGEDFATLAKEHSQGPSNEAGGDLGFFSRGGRMAKAFEDASFALQPGEISDIVETRYGYHIIKVTDRRTEVKIPFNYMKERIDEYLKQSKVLDEVDVFLAQLRANAKIERYLPENEDQN
jgi:peptidyl-prolyl cis-trans isomerase C